MGTPFLLAFVMTIIFGTMAQLISVVLEVGHVVVDVYYVILPLLGFWLMLALPPYGRVLVLVAMLVFAFENIATLKKTEILHLQ